MATAFPECGMCANVQEKILGGIQTEHAVTLNYTMRKGFPLHFFQF